MHPKIAWGDGERYCVVLLFCLRLVVCILYFTGVFHRYSGTCLHWDIKAIGPELIFEMHLLHKIEPGVVTFTWN